MSYVYLIETVCGDHPVAPCKLGITANPVARLKMLQCGSAQVLRYREIWDSKVVGHDARMMEAEFHRAMAKYRLTGEWFSLPPSDIEEVINFAISYCLNTEGYSPELAKATRDLSRCVNRTFDHLGRGLRHEARN